MVCQVEMKSVIQFIDYFGNYQTKLQEGKRNFYVEVKYINIVRNIGGEGAYVLGTILFHFTISNSISSQENHDKNYNDSHHVSILRIIHY